MIKNLFQALQHNQQDFLNAATGKQFEQRVMAKLDKLGFNRIEKSDVKEELKNFKSHVNDKWCATALLNTTKFKQHYYYQPFGSQQYPDFLIFLEQTILTIEVKFSTKKQTKPVWNSGLPRLLGIYIFASYGLQDITFFLGADVITPDEISKLHDFFDYGLKDYQNEFNAYETKQQKYGFSVYIRKAFDQKVTHNKHAIINYFIKDENRQRREASVIDYVSRPMSTQFQFQ